MKKLLFLICFLFLILPFNVFASSWSFNLRDNVDNLTDEEKEDILNNIYNNSTYKDFSNKYPNYKLIVTRTIFGDNFTYNVYFIDPNLYPNGMHINIDVNDRFLLSFYSNYFTLKSDFSTRFIYDSSYTVTIFNLLNGSDLDWNIIYSDFPIYTDIDFTIFEDSLVFKSFKSGDDILDKGDMKFENNTVYELSKKILGPLPEEYSFLYLFFAYIICIAFIITIIAPLVFIIKIFWW